MRWFSSSFSRDSCVRRAACSLSLLAVLIGSSGVNAQLNNETSPTHQFKSVSYNFALILGVCGVNNVEAGRAIREEKWTREGTGNFKVYTC